MVKCVRRLLAGLSLVAAGLGSPLTPTAGAAPPAPFQPKHEAADGTVLADREILDCAVKQHPVKNGPPPPPALVRVLISCLFEKPSIPGGDGAVTIDIDRLDIGAPRPWNPDQDVGSGQRTTLVYPVHAAWTRKVFHRTHSQVSAHDGTFGCYVTLLGTWTCETGPRIQDGEVKRILVK